MTDAMRVWREALDEYGRTSNPAAAAVIERAIAEAVEQERAKAEALAEALDLAEDTLKRVAMHHPDTPGLHYDSERSLLDSVTGIATQPLEYIRAAFRAWEDTDADVNTA